MGLKSFLRDLSCRLGFHDWDRPERPDVTAGLEVHRICRNCGRGGVEESSS